LKKYLHRTIIGLCVATSLTIVGAGVAFINAANCIDYLSNKKDEDVEEFVTQNIEQLIHAQEQKVGFTLFPPPPMEFMLPPSSRLKKTESNGITYGLYDLQEHVLYLNSGMLTLPSFDLSDIAARIGTAGNTKNVKSTLYHELGHYYCDRLYEHLLADFAAEDKLNDPFRLDKLIGLKIIQEGIGRYFENIMMGEEDSFQDREWPATVGDFFDPVALIMDQNLIVPEHLMYDGGYHLVKPVIDRYKKEGLLYLLHHIPGNVLELPQYQQKALEDLSRQ